jgi:hypothetical protein
VRAFYFIPLDWLLELIGVDDVNIVDIGKPMAQELDMSQ